jgi:FkbM family methyltransferase
MRREWASRSDRDTVARSSLLGFNVVAGSYQTTSYLFRDVMLSGNYDPGELHTVAPVIVDVGANIGFSILYFKRLFPASRIYAFEPNPEAFKFLQENVRTNNLDSVVLFNVGLGREEGRARLYLSAEHGDLRASVLKERGGARGIDVEIQRLSSFLKDIGEVDFLKVDCEGAEESIILDLEDRGMLAGIPRTVLEYHHSIGEEDARLGRFLQKLESANLEYAVAAAGLPFADHHHFQDILLRVSRRTTTQSP